MYGGENYYKRVFDKSVSHSINLCTILSKNIEKKYKAARRSFKFFGEILYLKGYYFKV